MNPGGAKDRKVFLLGFFLVDNPVDGQRMFTPPNRPGSQFRRARDGKSYLGLRTTYSSYRRLGVAPSHFRVWKPT